MNKNQISLHCNVQNTERECRSHQIASSCRVYSRALLPSLHSLYASTTPTSSSVPHFRTFLQRANSRTRAPWLRRREKDEDATAFARVCVHTTDIKHTYIHIYLYREPIYPRLYSRGRRGG